MLNGNVLSYSVECSSVWCGSLIPRRFAVAWFESTEGTYFNVGYGLVQYGKVVFSSVLFCFVLFSVVLKCKVMIRTVKKCKVFFPSQVCLGRFDSDDGTIRKSKALKSAVMFRMVQCGIVMSCTVIFRPMVNSGSIPEGEQNDVWCCIV